MRQIFVGGCERSGTSLVQKILVSHRRIAGGPELVFTGRVAELYRRMAADYPGPYATRLDAFYDRDELAAAFRSFFASLLRRVVEQKPGALFVSEKTPSNIFAAPQLLEIFPDAYFVHVVRDGRGVVASHREVEARFKAAPGVAYNRGTFRLRRICSRWNRAVEAYAELAAGAGRAGRVIEVRYEDLLRRPEETVSSLFHPLGLEPEPSALRPETISAEETGIPIDGFWTTQEMYQRPFDPRRIDRWKQALPPVVRMLASVWMAGNLQRLRYPVSRIYVGLHRLLRRASTRGTQTYPGNGW